MEPIKIVFGPYNKRNQMFFFLNSVEDFGLIIAVFLQLLDYLVFWQKLFRNKINFNNFNKLGNF